MFSAPTKSVSGEDTKKHGGAPTYIVFEDDIMYSNMYSDERFPIP